jgi:tetratricopeptide (TPR) repeat protein
MRPYNPVLVGLLSALFGGGGDLQKQLFDAASAGDRAKLGDLCRANRAAVISSFPGWMKVPADIQQDESKLQWYANGLMGVAAVFAEDLGFPGLQEQLRGTPESNPIDQWHETLGAAQQKMAEGDFDGARAMLESVLKSSSSSSMKGPGATRAAAAAQGLMGQCLFHSGKVEEAVAPAEAAVKAFAATEDVEGKSASLHSLYEIERWRGRAAQAAAVAEQLAVLIPDETGERLWKRQAAIVRGGEPLVRVIAVIDGVPYELDDAPTVRDGTVQFEFRRNRTTLLAAGRIGQEAQQHGSAGRYDEALKAFRAAAAIDRHDPHFRYLEGLTLLHMGKASEAVAAYEAAERLGPGWFHVRADRWTAMQMASGRIDAELFGLINALVDQPMEPSQKLELATAALQKVELAVLHLARGQALTEMGDRVDAAIALRKAVEVDGDADVRTRALMALAVVLDDPAEIRTTFQKAVALNGNLVSAAQARIGLKNLG